MGVKAVLKRRVVILMILMFLVSLVAVLRVSEVKAPWNLSLKWRWSASTTYPDHVQVVTTPIVAPLYDDNGDDIIDEQDDPYVIFSCFDNRTGHYWENGTIRVVHGPTGVEVPSTKFDPPDPTGDYAVSAYGQIAVADICDSSGTGQPNGIPEILAIRENGNGVICFDNAGFPLRGNTVPVPMYGAVTVSDITGPGGTGSPDGIPEVIVGREVFENDLAPLWTGSLGRDGFGISVVADLTMDGDPEVIVGNTAYENEIGSLPFWDTLRNLPDGYVAVADFIDETQVGVFFPEVVLVCPGQVRIGWRGGIYLLDDVETRNPLVWPAWPASPVDMPNGGTVPSDKWNGGPPTIGDFDGDGEPEIGVAGYDTYTVFDSNGDEIATFDIADSSSGLCGSSAFDFDGDEIDEIAYRDQDNLYIFSALGGGTVLDFISCSSYTGAELPTIVDIDKDCHAEIVVSADSTRPGGGGDFGIYVYENDEDDWSRTRCIWNQHAYDITNIESDASVPIPSEKKNNWEYFNNYRCQPSQPSTGLGNCIVAAGSDSGMFVLDFYGTPIWNLLTPFPVVSVAMDNDAKFIAFGTRDPLSTGGRLYLFTHQGEPLFGWGGKDLPISTSYDIFTKGTESKSVDVKYSWHNREVVVAAATDDGLYLFHQNGGEIWHYPHRQTIVRISQYGNYIVCADYNTGRAHYFSHMGNGQIGWQRGDGQPMWTWYMGEYCAFWVAISAHGEYVAISTWVPDAVVLIRGRGLRAGEVVWGREVGGGGMKDYGIRVDMPCDWGGRVVSANDDRSDGFGCELLCWDHQKNRRNGWQPDDSDPRWTFKPQPQTTADFYSVSISGSGKVAAAGGYNPPPAPRNYVFLYDLDTGTEIQMVKLDFFSTVQSVDLTFTGKYGVAGDEGGKIWFFSKHVDTPIWWADAGGTVHSVAISKSEPCFMKYPSRRDIWYAHDELIVGCLESDGDYAVLGYKASRPLTAPRWEMVNTWTIHNITGSTDRASPTVADLDNDGDYDLLISNAIDVPPMGYKNTGNRTHPIWQRCPAWDVPSLGSYEQNPDLADLDNDSDLDLCVAGPHYAAFFENNGTAESPSWKRKPEWDFDPLVHWPSPSLADLDNDGDYDLMFAAYNESYCAAWENNGTTENPNWTRKPDWNATGLPANHNKHLDLVDLDSDGDYDLMVGVGDPVRNITAYINSGTPMDPRWTRKPTWDIALPNMTWIRPAFANLDGVHDITVFDLTTSKTVVGQGYSIRINATITNEGDHAETFNTTIYANARIIQTKTITLKSGNSTTITLTWDTTGVAKGKYAMTAHATPVPGETDTTDNTHTDGWIIIAMVGDITGGTPDPLDFVPDGKVDMKDIATIARFYGQNVPPAPPNCDINCDGKIDMKDVATAARHFGETDP